MKLILICVFISASLADRLENTYLPPHNANTAGGNGHILNAPLFGKQTPHIQNNYLPPIGHYRNQFVETHGSSSVTKVQTNFGTTGAQFGTPVIPSTSYGVPTGAIVKLGGAQSREAGAAILHFNNKNNGDGTYRYEYDTENKISHHEIGELRNSGAGQETSYVHGSYSYTGDDGKIYTINYVADENGFQPTGDHIPTPPPIPEAIRKSLEVNAAFEAHSHISGENPNVGHHSNNVNRQYLAPNKPSFDKQSGYHY